MNTELHQGAGWGKGGTKFLDPIDKLAANIGAQTILDYGCGKGRLIQALTGIGYIAEGYDPCVPAYMDPPPLPADLLVSTDVLEHIEPEYLSNVLEHMASLALDAAFLVVSLVPAVKILPDGRNAHLIVESADWWDTQLEEYFPNVICTDVRRTTAEFVWLRG